jgi:hypothetical protein
MNPKYHNEQLLPPPLLGLNDDNAMDLGYEDNEEQGDN